MVADDGDFVESDVGEAACGGMVVCAGEAGTAVSSSESMPPCKA